MSTLPPEVAEAFASAAITALQELVQVETFPEVVGYESGPHSGRPVVIATIRLLRDQPGLMSLVLTIDTAAQLAARYLPEGTPLMPEMIDDVAGEFANVIAGQAKTMLKGSPYHFHVSLPTVARADAWHPGRNANANMTVGLVSKLGEILLHATVHPHTGHASTATAGQG
jgi:chemotaxis protein CheX